MIEGSCLCGTVRFEFESAEAPFVYCHCNRCRKFTGSAFFAALRAKDFKFLSGQEHIRSFEAPIMMTPPAYRKDFCESCGSPVPWHEIDDELPQFTDAQYLFYRIQEWDRSGQGNAADAYAYVIKYYPDSDVAVAARKRLAEIRGAES